MNAIQKYIRDAIIRSARSGEALIIDSLVEGSGVDHERVLLELDYFIKSGQLDAPGDLTRATAIQMRRLTAHGEIITQGKLDFAKDSSGEVIHLQMEDGGEPALVIGEDTYHVNIEPAPDGTCSMEIVECAGTKFESAVFFDFAFPDVHTARARADEWMRQRQDEGYRWEFRMEGHPHVSADIALIADVGLAYTEAALPPYRLMVACQHEGVPNPSPSVIQQDFDTAEDAWQWWAQMRRAWVEETFFADIPAAAGESPYWVGPLNVDADTLERCKNCLSFRELRDGGIAKPAIEIEGLPADGKWVCGQILPGTHEGVILLAVLSQVVPDCEGVVRFKDGGEGHSVTGSKAILYLGGYPEAEWALGQFMAQEGVQDIPLPEAPEINEDMEEVAPDPLEPQTIAEPEPASASQEDEDDSDFPF